MKIAFSPTIFRVQSEGGISRYFYQLITGIVKSGHDVYVGNQAISGKYLDFLLEASISTGSAIEKHVGNLFLNPRWPFGWMPRSLSVWKPDIIHETYYSTKWFGNYSQTTKKVITIYDLIEEKLQPSTKNNSSKSQALSLIDHAICISEMTQEDLIRIHNFPIEKTSVINLAPFPIPDRSQHNLFTEPINDKPFFLFIGARAGYKNFTKLIESFSKFVKNNSAYELIAFGGGNFTEQELLLLKRFSVTTSVKQISGNDDLLSRLLTSTIALVYPSLMEGFGMPPLEALMMGTPVICSEIRPMIDILSKDSVFFFNPFSTEDLLMKMLIVIESHKSVESMILGKRLASAFTWEKCVNQTLTVYKNLISETNLKPI